MQHNLDRVVLVIGLVALGPVIAHRVRKDVAVAVEVGGRDGRAHVGVALEAVLGVLVPEVESPVRAGCREGAVNRVEGDVVDRVHVGHVALRRVSVAFEGEVGAGVAKSTECQCFGAGE